MKSLVQMKQKLILTLMNYLIREKRKKIQVQNLIKR